MKKFVNALGVIFLFILIFGIIGKSLDFDVLDKNDDPNSDDPIVNPGDFIGPGTNNPSVESRIAVPNTGYLNKVYFDTSLSVDEVVEIASKVDTSLYDGAEYLLLTEDGSKMIMLLNADGIVFIGDKETTYFHNITDSDMLAEAEVDFEAGWNPNITMPVIINANVINYFLGEDAPICRQNDKLIDLFYTYPSELIKEEVTTLGTPVPTSGMVENVYFNTSLSNEEVVNIIENANLTYDIDGYYDVFEHDENNALFIFNGGEGFYTILSMVEGNPSFIFSTQENQDIGVDFVGWNAELQNFILFNLTNNLNGESGEGDKNQELSSLISTTPFN